MADILKASNVMPGFREAARIYLVEMSPALRALQQEKLGARLPGTTVLRVCLKGRFWLSPMNSLMPFPSGNLKSAKVYGLNVAWGQRGWA